MSSKDFNSAYAKLNPNQKKAVDHIDGPVLVIAGPGTGKTQLLALRAANILKKTDVSAANILCLTYTEVGAKNMRERLTSLIGQPAYDVRISTYHGFGSDLIRQYGEYFSEAGDEQPIDKIGQDAIMRHIYKTLPTSNLLWREDTYLKDALEFIKEAKQALLTAEDLRTIAKANQKFITQATQFSLKIPVMPRLNNQFVPYFQKLLEDLATIKTTPPLPNSVHSLRELMIYDLNQALEEFALLGKTPPITKFKDKWLKKDLANRLEVKGLAEVAKLNSAANIYELYQTELKNRKLYDYSDMISRAINGLSTNDDLRFNLHEQFQYVMLDEFQDTNKAQLKLVELLTNNPVVERRPNVLAVGDDDQAIYSFQGAEIEGSMVEFTRLYKDVEIITLTENYRSHSDILTTAYNVANTIEERLTKLLQADAKVLTASNQAITTSTVERHQFKSDAGQFDWVASQIQKLIKQGVAPSEIAVLAPKHKHIEPLVPYLQAKNIPIKYEKRENVFDDPQIVELFTAAKLIKSLAENNQAEASSLWPAVLSAPHWELSTSSIWQLSWQASDNQKKEGQSSNWQILMLDNKATRPIALFFARLALIAQTETLENVLDYLVGVQALSLNEPELPEYKSPFYDYYFGSTAKNNKPQKFVNLLSNLTVLRQNLRQYKLDLNRPLNVFDLLEFANDYNRAGEKLLNTSPYHSGDNAVQLLTAYGAKGLEFEAVFVLATHDNVWGMKTRSPNSNVSLPLNLKFIRRASSSKDERKRLFFVALTRAKHTLYLLGYDQDYSGKTTEPVEFLAEAEQVTAILPINNQAVRVSDQDIAPVESLKLYWTDRHVEGAYSPQLLDFVKPRLESYLLSATHLNSFLDVSRGGPADFFVNSILKFPKAPSSDGQFGSAIHETLESVQYYLSKHHELPELNTINEMFETKLKQKKLSETEYNRLKNRGAEALKKFMPHWQHNFIPGAQSEFPFLHEGVFVGDAHLNGKIDQILSDNDTKQVRVVDFKTGKPLEKWKKEVQSHKYQNQLIFYKLLVENSHSFKNHEVDEAKLVFVEPDSLTEKMHELEIEYKPEEVVRLEKIIQAVWARIMNLDFPDVSQFSPNYKGMIDFENWLIENSS